MMSAKSHKLTSYPINLAKPGVLGFWGFGVSVPGGRKASDHYGLPG